jgi:hypothetical protein
VHPVTRLRAGLARGRSLAGAGHPGRGRSFRRARGLGRAAALATLALAAALATALPARAQQVTFSGRADPELDRRIAALLTSGRYTLLARDTTIRAGDTLRGPVLAPGIKLRLDGTVDGELIGVASDLFLHPTAVVTGEVVNAGGGFYPSTQVRLGGSVDRPLARYTVTREGSAIRILGSGLAGPTLALDPFSGMHPPQYDRADVLWLQAGAGLRLPSPAAIDSARLHLVGGWRTDAPGATYTADLQLHRGRYTLLFGGERLTATQDLWIRGDLANTLAFLSSGSDYRDYYDVRRLFGFVARDFDAGRWGGHLALRAGREQDLSLRAHDPWVLFRPDSLRPNPAIAEGVISSAGAEAALGWTGVSASFVLGGEIEAAGRTLGGDFAFGRYLAWGRANMEALWGHTLAVEWQVRGPLPGTDSLPRQRWSFVGGGGTLPTFAVGRFPGDRIAFVSSEYVMPLPRALRLPQVGPPRLAILHAAGMGWTRAGSATLEQDVGLELRVLALAVNVVTNPANARHDLRFGGGLAFSTGRGTAAHPYFDTRAAER